jgi:outer membrane lipoprotein SlyB
MRNPRVARSGGLLYVGAVMRNALLLLLPLALAGCGSSYSPDAYATRAVQQLNRVDQGVVVGRRNVAVQADGATGAATGGAAGGIIGAQTPGGNITGAIGAVGGALVGGLFGSAAERVAGDTTAFEYIVRKENAELVTVTQRDATALEIGTRVLVIGGAQARIVPDYTQPLPVAGSAGGTAPAAGAAPGSAPNPAPPPAEAAPAAASEAPPAIL